MPTLDPLNGYQRVSPQSLSSQEKERERELALVVYVYEYYKIYLHTCSIIKQVTTHNALDFHINGHIFENYSPKVHQCPK